LKFGIMNTLASDEVLWVPGLSLYAFVLEAFRRDQAMVVFTASFKIDRYRPVVFRERFTANVKIDRHRPAVFRESFTASFKIERHRPAVFRERYIIYTGIKKLTCVTYRSTLRSQCLTSIRGSILFLVVISLCSTQHHYYFPSKCEMIGGCIPNVDENSSTTAIRLCHFTRVCFTAKESQGSAIGCWYHDSMEVTYAIQTFG
jgi:hypothetical protein